MRSGSGGAPEPLRLTLRAVCSRPTTAKPSRRFCRSQPTRAAPGFTSAIFSQPSAVTLIDVKVSLASTCQQSEKWGEAYDTVSAVDVWGSKQNTSLGRRLSLGQGKGT